MYLSGILLEPTGTEQGYNSGTSKHVFVSCPEYTTSSIQQECMPCILNNICKMHFKKVYILALNKEYHQRLSKPMLPR